MRNRTTIITLLLFMLASLESSGQIMEWMIHPSYKDIVCLGKDLYKVKGANGKWGIFNTSRGELTVPIEYDNISPLVEGRILILDAQGEKLYGIVNEAGVPVSQLIPASQKPDFVVMKDYPYYSDGLLVIGQPSGQYYNYGYVDKQGNLKVPFKYLYACPFDHGQAMVYTKKGAYQIIDQQGNFPYVGNEKINFLSNPKNGVFILVTGNNRISKVKLDNSKFVRLEDIEKGQVVRVADATIDKSIYSKGPEGRTYRFDNAFHLIEGNSPSTISPVKTISESNNKLKKQKEGWLYGINYNNIQILPKQFKDVKVFEDEYAVVTMDNSSVGLLRLNPSGEINVNASPSTIEFTHNQEINIPVSVVCNNTMTRPVVEFSVVGDSQNRVFKCQGSGQVEIPFYEAHNQIGKTTSKTLEIEMQADKLYLGRKDFNVTSSHQQGFKIHIGDFPEYSKKDGSAIVNVKISSIGGTPSQSAVAKVNGNTYSFNGNGEISTSVRFSIPERQTRNCSVNVTVSEDGCPSSSSSKTRPVKHLSIFGL